MLLSKKVTIYLIAIFILSSALIYNININQQINSYKLYISLAFILISIIIFFISPLKNSLLSYLKNSYEETKKVVWPEKNEVIRITLTIFVFVLIMGIFLWITDASLGWLVYDVILGWR